MRDHVYRVTTGTPDPKWGYGAASGRRVAKEKAMGLFAWNRWLAVAGALAVLGTGVLASPASADDDEVVRRLSKYGKLSAAEARRVVASVSSRMKQAADMANANDPVRAAVSTALYGSSAPAD